MVNHVEIEFKRAIFSTNQIIIKKRKQNLIRKEGRKVCYLLLKVCPYTV